MGNLIGGNRKKKSISNNIKTQNPTAT